MTVANKMLRVPLLISAVALLIALLSFSVISVQGAGANSENATEHCPDHSSSSLALNKVESASGEETVNGVIFKWSGDPGVLKVKNTNSVQATIKWCAKGGTEFYDGSKITGEITTVLEAGNKATVEFGTEVSYFLVYSVTLKEEPEYYFQFAKVWSGDKVDTTNVTVVFTAEGGFSWTLGTDEPVVVEPGVTTLTNVKEVITGLPTNCTYTSNLPSTITAPRDTELYGEDMIFTLDITNTVDCTEGTPVNPPATLGTQVTAVPTGAVDAGAGTSLLSGLAGLIGSVAIVAVGTLLRKFNFAK